MLCNAFYLSIMSLSGLHHEEKETVLMEIKGQRDVKGGDKEGEREREGRKGEKQGKGGG